jgi:hypothetical protein
MLKLIRAVISRDLRLAMRRQADIVAAMFFFIIVVSLFPLGVGPEPDQLRKLAPGCCGLPRCWRRCFRCRGCLPTTTATARWNNWRWHRNRSA